MAVIVDPEKCIGCGNCEAVCPANAIRRNADRIAEVAEDKCLECSACMGDCEGKAIHWPKQVLDYARKY